MHGSGSDQNTRIRSDQNKLIRIRPKFPDPDPTKIPGFGCITRLGEAEPAADLVGSARPKFSESIAVVDRFVLGSKL